MLRCSWCAEDTRDLVLFRCFLDLGGAFREWYVILIGGEVGQVGDIRKRHLQRRNAAAKSIRHLTGLSDHHTWSRNIASWVGF